ncbi:outer membrane protein assembly factor [bacterium]|nr:outer membrane protein assembly factor [bacterium]
MNKEQNEPVPALVLTGMEVEDLNAENLQPVFAADKSADADEVCEEVSPKNIDFASLNNSVSPLDNARSQIHSDVKRSSGEAAARSSADFSNLVSQRNKKAASSRVGRAFRTSAKKEKSAAAEQAEAKAAPSEAEDRLLSDKGDDLNAKAAADGKLSNAERAQEVAEAIMGAPSAADAGAERSEAAEAAPLTETAADENGEIAESKTSENAEIAESENAGKSGEIAESKSGADAAEADKEAAVSENKTDEKAEADSGDKAAAAKGASPVFSGTVEAISENSLLIAGTGSDGEPLSLEFIVDENSQLAEGIKVGDSLSVYYELAESGGYRVTSARYVSGEAPQNVFPGETAENIAEGDGAKDETGTDQNAEADLPKVVSIEVEGNKTVSSAEVLQIISTRIGDPLLEPRIRRDMQAIYDSGYYTDVRLDTRYTSDGVRIIFRVLENPVVDEIEITGNSVVETDKLRSLMQMETGKVLNTRVLQNDIQAINKYYNEDLGYTISPSHITKLDFSKGKLTFTVVDGIIVKEVKVEGVTVFPQEEIEKMITLKPGDLFNRNTLREDTEKISDLYEKKEYILDTIKPSVDVETGVVTVSVVEAVLEDYKLNWADANHRTKDETVLRNLRTKKNEVMRRDRIQKDLERLNNLGLFKKVEPGVEPGSKPGMAILVLNIEEQKTGLATVGVGYAGGGSGAVRPGITGAVSYSERNLFGEGKQISINLQRGAQIGSYGISYYDPAINDAQDSLGVSIYYNNVDELEQQVTGADYGTYAYYDQEAYGGTITYGHPFSDDLRGFITLRHETINLKMSKKSLYVPVGIGKGDLNAIGVSALYDTRDDVFNPHRGTYGSAAYTFAGLGGDYKYNKFVFEGRQYIPITKRSTLALRGLYGTVGNGAPASEYFYAGGTDTLRGYKDNVFFGNKVVLLNAEYRFPIADIKMVSGAVFFDAGNAWLSGYGKSRLYTDAGVGLRIVFPNLGLGVIRIDYAFGEEGSRASVGIGQSF